MDGLVMKYFVLKPGGKGAHAKASRMAMATYAVYMEEENPQFAKELKDWVRNEKIKSREIDRRKTIQDWKTCDCGHRCTCIPIERRK